jgi:hypothetical protein
MSKFESPLLKSEFSRRLLRFPTLRVRLEYLDSLDALEEPPYDEAMALFPFYDLDNDDLHDLMEELEWYFSC